MSQEIGSIKDGHVIKYLVNAVQYVQYFAS